MWIETINRQFINNELIERITVYPDGAITAVFSSGDCVEYGVEEATRILHFTLSKAKLIVEKGG